MEICLLPLRMRRERLGTQARPLQVNGNNEGIAIASSSFFLDAHPSGVVCVARHGSVLSCLLYHVCGDFIQFVSPRPPTRRGSSQDSNKDAYHEARALAGNLVARSYPRH